MAPSLFAVFSLLVARCRAAAIGKCIFDLSSSYISLDFPNYSFQFLRADTGTINGPLPVQPNAPDPQYDYDVNGYVDSFQKLGLSWVRFQDLGMTEGGTSLTQIFTAWPLNDEDLRLADVKKLCGDSANFNFTSLDLFVKAAVSSGAKIDFRLGDSHQIASLLQAGEPIPVGSQMVKFPKQWAFPTDIETDKGMDLWSSVAIVVAKRVWQLVGRDRKKVAFDLLTETTEGNCFWPSSAARYAQLYSKVMTKVKAEFGDDVQCIGANTISPMKPSTGGGDPWLLSFLKECNRMGYQQCPLDVVAFHIFNPKVAALIPENSKWVMSQMMTHLTNFSIMPKLAMTAWGFHGSGMYGYNDQPIGAAIMANSLMAIENSPIEFMIYYKWAGINCKDLHSPCLVVNVPGTLKPTAIPLKFHAHMRAVGVQRIAAKCTDINVIAVRREHNTKVSAMLAPAAISSADSTDIPSMTPIHVQIKGLTCASEMVSLTLESVNASMSPDGSAQTMTTKVLGQARDDGFFVANGVEDAFAIPSGHLPFASLITLSCERDAVLV